jgi:hypothetical protein
MIKRVAYSKAFAAGFTGAFVWELVARVLIAFGAPVRDTIYLMGTFIYPQSSTWQWLLIGTGVHCLIGIIWAIFYAYSFWAVFDWKPAIQGLVFSMLVTLLAGFIVIPQLDLMHPLIASGQLPHAGVFAHRAGVVGPLNLILGHALYGWILGSMYTHPVGYAIRCKVAHG